MAVGIDAVDQGDDDGVGGGVVHAGGHAGGGALGDGDEIALACAQVIVGDDHGVAGGELVVFNHVGVDDDEFFAVKAGVFDGGHDGADDFGDYHFCFAPF